MQSEKCACLFFNDNRDCQLFYFRDNIFLRAEAYSLCLIYGVCAVFLTYALY